MKLGILTGGGDVPGLNPCIKAVVNRAIDEGHEIIGLRRGWGALLNYNIDDSESSYEHHIYKLDKQTVRRIDRTGGTFLHTSRTNPTKVKASEVPIFLRDNSWSPDQPPKDYTAHAKKVVEHLGIDVLITIGGDDTLSYSDRMHRENVPIIGIPKTMDNDVFGTDYCIGFSTAVTRSVTFIHNMRTSVGSHERIGVLELFGRNSGETSLIAAYLGNVDRAIISEVPFDINKLTEFVVQDRKDNPSNYSLMTISEGATLIGGSIVESGEADAYGHKKLGGVGQITAELIKEIGGVNIMYQQFGYLMRSGAPDSLDLMVAMNYAHLAMDLALAGKSGRMVALQKGVYVDIPMETVMQGKKRVEVEQLYDVDQYKPMVKDVAGMPMFLH